MQMAPDDVPSLVYDFGHSMLAAAELGPGRELTLTVAIVQDHGHRGRYAHTVRVSFGGIQNLAEVSSLLGDPIRCRELVRLGYSRAKPSRPGHLVFELACEGVDGVLEILCRRVEVSGPRS